MKNSIKVYSIEWHNEECRSQKYFGEDYEKAKKEYDECSSKDRFNVIELIEIEYIGYKPIFNKEHLIEVLRGYYYDLRPTEILFQKQISNNGLKPTFTTADLAGNLEEFKASIGQF